MKKVQSFLELPFSFDIEKLKADLQTVSKTDWVDHPNTNAYDGEWSVVSLTSIDGDIKSIVAFENQEYQETSLMKRTQYIKEVLESFHTKIEAVRFMKLGVHSTIKEHCDKGSSFEEGYARLHIPITSNDEVEFILSGKNYKMELGKCYYIDAHNSHSVINKGDSDRVHLLIDCHVNEWLKSIFLKGGFKEPVYKYGDKSITDKNVDDIIASFREMGTDTALEMAETLEKKKVSNG